MAGTDRPAQARRPSSGSGPSRPRPGSGRAPSRTQQASSSGNRPRAERSATATAEPEGRHRRSGEHPRKKRNILWRLRKVLFLFGLIIMAGVAAAAAVVSRLELTDPRELRQSSYICAGDLDPEECTADNAMARLTADDDRTFVPLDEMPQMLIDAVIAVEDRKFFEHQGISPEAIARALYQDVRGAGGSQQGGSTITQQYIKEAYLTQERTYDRKVREAVLAMKLEQQMSKEDILEAYLNTIYFGRKALGVQAASRVYFDKDVQELTLAEAALLAGLIRSPNTADPHENPDEAERRRAVSLNAMLEEGYITQDEHDLAMADDWSSVQPYEGHRLTHTMRGAEYGTEYITQYVVRELSEMGYSDEEVTGDGLRVYITLDLEMQKAAYESIYGENGLLTEEGDPAAALVSLNNEGKIRALVGGQDFRENEVNLAVAGMGSSGRPVGSTYKPIALAAAVQDGYSLTNSTYNSPARLEDFDTTIDGEPIQGCADTWTLQNYAETEHTGTLNLVDATAQSSNTAYAQMMMELTPERVHEMGRELGYDSHVEPCAPTILGTDDSNALEMAEVYSVFANRGIHWEPQIVTRVERVDAEGNVELDWEADNDDRQRRAMAEDRADLVTHALQAVVQEGTGTGAQLPHLQTAGKTGTTNANTNAWFVGYTPNGFTTAVWMGYAEEAEPVLDENGEQVVNEDGEPEWDLRSMDNVRGGPVTGGGLPTQIWQTYMGSVSESWEGEFPEPDEEALAEGRSLGLPAPADPPPDRGRDRGGDDSDQTTTTTTTTQPQGPPITIEDPCVTNPTLPRCNNGGGGGGGGDDPPDDPDPEPDCNRIPLPPECYGRDPEEPG